jgi:hypothetical protein
VLQHLRGHFFIRHPDFIKEYLISQEIFDRIAGKKAYTAAMVREADLNKVEVPEQFEVLDADALARRLGLKRQTVQAYMARGWWHLIPRPNRKLSMGPVWYESSIRDWEGSRERG